MLIYIPIILPFLFFFALSLIKKYRSTPTDLNTSCFSTVIGSICRLSLLLYVLRTSMVYGAETNIIMNNVVLLLTIFNLLYGLVFFYCCSALSYMLNFSNAKIISWFNLFVIKQDNFIEKYGKYLFGLLLLISIFMIYDGYNGLENAHTVV